MSLKNVEGMSTTRKLFCQRHWIAIADIPLHGSCSHHIYHYPNSKGPASKLKNILRSSWLETKKTVQTLPRVPFASRNSIFDEDSLLIWTLESVKNGHRSILRARQARCVFFKRKSNNRKLPIKPIFSRELRPCDPLPRKKSVFHASVNFENAFLLRKYTTTCTSSLIPSPFTIKPRTVSRSPKVTYFDLKPCGVLKQNLAKGNLTYKHSKRGGERANMPKWICPYCNLSRHPPKTREIGGGNPYRYFQN